MNRQEVNDFIINEFNVEGEHLWMKFPEYAVYRNSKNNKWFALLAEVERSKLKLEGDGKINIINVKCDPILISSLIKNEGYLPAYHMSKKTWVTVLLDGSAPDDQIKDLIHLSFDLVKKSR